MFTRMFGSNNSKLLPDELAQLSELYRLAEGTNGLVGYHWQIMGFLGQRNVKLSDTKFATYVAWWIITHEGKLPDDRELRVIRDTFEATQEKHRNRYIDIADEF